MAERGHFIITDISGYTAFLTKAELEHAEDILRHLIGSVLENTLPPLSIAKLEGDAIFSYSPEGSFLQGQTLLETVENMYAVFRETLEQTRLNTTCTCNACRLIPTLDLKFVVHYGEYMVQQMGGMRDLQGMEVITVHRLLKNHIVEATGCKAYAFFSEAAVQAANMQACVEPMIRHTEEYEHVGQVPGYVHDLHPVWERQRELHRDVIQPEETWLASSVDLPIPQPLAWDYVTRPDLKTRWMGVISMTLVKPQRGRQFVGSEQHCAHDSGVSIFKITDWRPFDYYTVQYELMPGVAARDMTRLTPIEGGTRVERCVSHCYGTNLRGRLMAPIMERMATRMMRKGGEEGFERLAEIVQEDLAAGVIASEPADPLGIAREYVAAHPFKPLTPITSSAAS